MGTNTNTGVLPPQWEDDPGFRCWLQYFGHLGSQNITTITEIGIFFPRWMHTVDTGLGRRAASGGHGLAPPWPSLRRPFPVPDAMSCAFLVSPPR
eukprot:9476458-Pyramimonas_sp.AAC.1